MCGGIFKHDFIANLPLNLLAEFFYENRLILEEVMGKSLVSRFFRPDGMAVVARRWFRVVVS